MMFFELRRCFLANHPVIFSSSPSALVMNFVH